jgi:hypothetical protein
VDRPSGRTAIIIMDMWHALMPDDAEYHAFMLKDIQALAKLIARVTRWEAVTHDTHVYVNSPTGTKHPGTDDYSMDVNETIEELQHIRSLNNNVTDIFNTEYPAYDNILLCGVHLGRCINRAAKDLKDFAYLNPAFRHLNVGVLINLSMPFPCMHADTSNYAQTPKQLDDGSHDALNTYYWAYHNIIPVGFNVHG